MTAPAAIASACIAERRSRAFLRLLANICRHFPDLRTWLMEDFGRDAATRTNFAALVERGDLGSEEVSDGFAEVSGELGVWLEEKRRLKAQWKPEFVPQFGGLTWDEMETLTLPRLLGWENREQPLSRGAVRIAVRLKPAQCFRLA
jgi:hypothetical protein